MTVTWLGQAGLLLRTQTATILADPYLSDSAAPVSGHRRQPIDPRFLSVVPDILLCTHNHLDHADPQTLSCYLREDTAVTVLSPHSVYTGLRTYPGRHNLVEMSPGVVWTQQGIAFTAVKAVHSDPYAIGFLISDGRKTHYITGDTLYHPGMLGALPPDIDTVFLPINGRGNNMNADDAASLAARIGARRAVPLHWGMLDDIDPRSFRCACAVIPELYKEMTL